MSRCQGVMFYLKENNLRYWSGGVRLSLSLLFPLFFTFSARMRSSDQTHVKIIFCFFPSLSLSLYIYVIYMIIYLKNVQMMYCHALLISLKQMYIISFSLPSLLPFFSLSLHTILSWSKWILSSFIQVSHKCHSIISFFPSFHTKEKRASERGRTTEKAYFFLLPYRKQCESGSFWLKVKVV